MLSAWEAHLSCFIISHKENDINIAIDDKANYRDSIIRLKDYL